MEAARLSAAGSNVYGSSDRRLMSGTLDTG